MSSWYDKLMNEPDEEATWCVPSSMFNAFAWGSKRKVPTRIIVQRVDKEKNIDHMQAEYQQEDGTWVPLSEFWNGKSMVVRPFKRHYPNIEPYRVRALDEVFKEQYDMIKKGGE